MSPLLYRLSYGPAPVTIGQVKTYCTTLVNRKGHATFQGGEELSGQRSSGRRQPSAKRKGDSAWRA